MIAAPAQGMRVEQIPAHHPVIQEWVKQFHAKHAPHFSHAAEYVPAHWLAVLVGDRVLCAFSYTHCVGNVVLVEYALCEPSRIGLMSLKVLMQMLYAQWLGKFTIRFYVERMNLRMRAMVEALGAHDVASLYQIGV